MSTADMLAELLRLPAEERARLALELIRSVDAGTETGAADIALPPAEKLDPVLTTLVERELTLLGAA